MTHRPPFRSRFFALVLVATQAAPPVFAFETPRAPEKPRAVEKPREPEKPPAPTVNRTQPAITRAPDRLAFSSPPTDAEFYRARVFEEPLVPSPGGARPSEDSALAALIQDHLSTAASNEVEPFAAFLRAHPGSRWKGSLLLDLGIVYRHTGYLTRALDAWEQSWALLKGETDPRLAALADRAVGELAELNARLGRQERLSRLLAEIDARDVRGPASEKVTAAREGYSVMQKEPERAFLCGPFGLDRILASVRQGYTRDPKIADAKSTPQGTSMLQMFHLADSVGLKMQIARRSPGAAVVVPALVHWKAGHFAALVKDSGDRLLIQDPTFGDELWVSRAALDAEASGMFLVPAGTLPQGWEGLRPEDGQDIWGKGMGEGAVPQFQGGCPTVSAPKCTNCKDNGGMAGYSVNLLLVNLHITDVPVGYSPPVGPAMTFSVAYNQREVFQPQLPAYSNVGPKWTFDWFSFVEDNPANASQNVNVYLRQGGQETYSGMAAGTSDIHYRSRAIMVRTSATTYERRLTDGSVEVFARPDGATGFPRRVYLTEIHDPQGNVVTLAYSYEATTGGFRVVSATDAIGQVTTFDYEGSDPLKVTKVTDPFGRFAQFEYDTSGRLKKITDVIGITSEFTYGASDFISSLTTPYGTTSFVAGQNGTTRWLETTDPLGAKERFEFSDWTAEISNTEASAPAGMSIYNTYLSARNTFYWDKRAMALFPLKDYTKARIYHWLHSGANQNLSSGILESVKDPLESRVWYNYPDQWQTNVEGTAATPTAIGRVLDDGMTQLYKYEYNSKGLKTRETDPLARTTTYTYDTNGIDPLEINQVDGQDLRLVARYTYNDKHQPLTITDARGAVTTYTYNAAGQVLTLTTPPTQGHSQGPTTTYTYDNDGKLQQITGPVSGTNATFTYDGYGRSRTITNPAGLTRTFDYDALDRVTRVSYPDGTYEETVYNRLDGEGSRDRLGRWTHTFHDALRRVVALRDAASHTMQFQYGSSGCSSCGGGGDQIAAVVDANGNTTRWEHDLQGRVTQETRADGANESFSYETTSSRLKQKTDRKNVTTTFEYFLDDRLKRKSFSDATPAVSYMYDPVTGLLLTAANGTDTLTWAYDSMGRLATEASMKNGATVGYSYDDAGNRTAVTLDGSTHASYGYDEQGRMTSITRGASVFIFAYDSASRRTVMTQPNGVITTYGYDDQSRPISSAATRNGTTITSFSYVLDAVGNRTRKTTPEWSEDYRYGAVNELVSADRSAGVPSRWRFAYDASGNRTAAQADDSVLGASFNNVNKLQGTQPGGALTFKGTTSEGASVTVGGVQAQTATDNSFSAQAPVASGTSNVVIAATDASGNTRTNTYQVNASGAGESYTYDANGNLATKAAGSDNWIYTWNAENQLLKVEKNGAEVARYAYDPMGRRVEKVAAGVTSAYTHDGMDLLREVRGSTALRYVHGPWVDEPLSADDGASPVYFHADGLGSITKTTNSAGAVVLTRQYDAWGNPEAGAAEPGFAFGGRDWEPEAGLYYYRARYYDPKVGRFLSPDPLGMCGGVNLYSYVENGPTNFRDPLGLLKFGGIKVTEDIWPVGRTQPGVFSITHECRSKGGCNRYGVEFTVAPYVIKMHLDKNCPDWSRSHEMKHVQAFSNAVIAALGPLYAAEGGSYGSKPECDAAAMKAMAAAGETYTREAKKTYHWIFPFTVLQYIPCVVDFF